LAYNCRAAYLQAEASRLGDKLIVIVQAEIGVLR